MAEPLRIGTRGSDLALAQAHHIAGLLGGAAIEVIRTRGDALLHLNLQDNLEKGFFTQELEQALLGGRIDLAVHSLKDLPTEQPAGLALAGVPPRERVGDLLLLRRDALHPEQDPQALDEGRPLLRAGARIGTSAARRVALLEHFFVTAVPTALRGNVPTRVGRAIEGRVDGVVLAAAGLARLRLDPRPLIAVALRPERWTPAPAQGALGLQCRAGDRATEAALARLTDPVAQRCVAAERSLLAKMEGGCHAAFGACARVLPSGELHLAAGLRGEVSSWLAVDSAGPDEAVVDTLFAVLSAGADAADRSACWTAAEAWW